MLKKQFDDNKLYFPKVAVVIPCFKVTKHVLGVINAIGPEVCRIYVIDDCCPDMSGEFVKQNCNDSRVIVARNHRNLGVGGAVLAGYQLAIVDDMEIIVKIDGDGQMNPELVPEFITPIVDQQADYTKGNRFFDLEGIRAMPSIRVFGNAVLSFLTKLSSGYWQVFDPTNGFTAIHVSVARQLPFTKVSNRYFFESDMLFRLNTMRAVVLDIPMYSHYGTEVSNLKIKSVMGEFLIKHFKNFTKRIFYNYYLRDMSIGSVLLPLGASFVLFGMGYGSFNWLRSFYAGTTTPSGTVMLAALPLLLGIQFILSFIASDIASVPTRPVCRVRWSISLKSRLERNADLIQSGVAESERH